MGDPASESTPSSTGGDAVDRPLNDAALPDATVTPDATVAPDAAVTPDAMVAPDTANVVDRLAHVVDDTDGREEAVKWAENQLLSGATFEVVSAELLSQGWPPASADSIVEEAREATRTQRGVRTREDVVIGVYRKFGKTMRRVRWLIVIGIVIVIIAVSMFLNRE